MVHPPRRDPQLGVVYPFKMGIRVLATISQPLASSSRPWRPVSHLVPGDQLFGESIDGFSGKPIKGEKVSKASGRHKGSFVKIRKHAYAHVEIGVTELLQRKPKDEPK